MGCLSFSVTPSPQAGLTAKPTGQAQLELKGYPDGEPHLSAKLNATPTRQATLVIGEVCSVAGGEVYVLAGTDGPLRTRDGGYLLLDPSRET